MLRTWFTIPLACFVIASIQASEPPITVADLAHLTGYPAEKLKVKDETASANEKAALKKKPECLSHHVYSSEDDTFATVSVAIGKKGTLLTPELDVKAKEILEKAALTPDAPVKLRALSLGPGVQGYSGLGMAGGGGSMDRSVVSLSNHDRDIQITILFGENALTPLAGADAYQQSIVTSEGVNAIIEKCLTVVSNNIVASSSSGVPMPHPRPSTEKSKPVPSFLPERTAPATPSSDQTPMANGSTLASTPVPQHPAVGVELRASVWPLVVGAILALIVIGALVLKLRA